MNSGRRERIGVAMFYVMFFALLAAEGAIVGGVEKVSATAGASAAGPWIAWLLFVIGGAALGAYELHVVTSPRRLRDPILRLCCHLQSRYGLRGFVVNAAVLGGAPGTAIALRKVNATRPGLRMVIAAVIFASVWVPIYDLFWR